MELRCITPALCTVSPPAAKTFGVQRSAVQGRSQDIGNNNAPTLVASQEESEGSRIGSPTTFKVRR
jgi:hypothetical protein